jgi:hypothetical protein
VATDKTQLTEFSDSKSAYPVYLTLGNIPRSIRRKPSHHACILIAYLSVDKNLKEELSKREMSGRAQRLFHDSLRIIMEPLKDAGREGMEVVGGDGSMRMVFPVLSCYVADYPEQCLVTCTKYGTCPKCKARAKDLSMLEDQERRTQEWTINVIQDAFATTDSHNSFRTKCMQRDVGGGVFSPFWEGFPHCDIHLSVTPDVLHQLYQGIFKHMVEWVGHLMDPDELDRRISRLPPCYGVRHFGSGWSHLGNIGGKERKQMARILLGCLIGQVPAGVIRCYRALLDFIYLAQYQTHDDQTLKYMQDALDLFHANKEVLINLEVRDHLDIPKLHSLQHYIDSIRLFGTTDNYNTEMFERFHIDFCKEGWYASNGRDEKPQMITWLSRREKVAAFQSYLKMTVDDEDPDFTFTHSRFAEERILLAKQPHRQRQEISDIMEMHNCPGFESEIKRFLNNKNAGSISRGQLQDTPLPFTSLNVHHSFRFRLETLGNDVDFDSEESDAVKAKPQSKGHDARFDTVVIMERKDCDSTSGLTGVFSSLLALESY